MLKQILEREQQERILFIFLKLLHPYHLYNILKDTVEFSISNISYKQHQNQRTQQEKSRSGQMLLMQTRRCFGQMGPKVNISASIQENMCYRQSKQ